MRAVLAALGFALTAQAVHGQTSELRFPADQFDRAAYRPTQAAGDPRYEAILMDMRDANFEALANYDASDDVRRLAEPVGLLKVMLKGDSYITCTASVIDAGLILTNWHCLPKYGAAATKAALWMGFYSDDERGTQGYSVDLKPVETDRALDYAILKVTGDLSRWGRVRLAAVDPPANRSLAIVHHPAGRPKQLTQRSCRTADPALAKGELRHKCDTLAGSSGAPVFFGAGEAARMVALHFAGVPQSLRGVDPSFEANLAIPLSRIAEKSAVVKRLVAGGSPPPALRATSPASGGGIVPPPAGGPDRASGEVRGGETSTPGTIFRDTMKDGSKGPEMVVLPRGGFWMGSPDGEGEANQRPQRRVEIRYDLAIGKYEVTWDEYNACFADGGCKPVKEDGFGGGKRPVTNVSWNDAKAYAVWLSMQTGAKYRLPSEAEWEYAARAKSTTAYPRGTEIGRNKANCYGDLCGDSFDNTAPVGSFAASAFGLHDMIGNVWEWVEDCYADNYSAGQAADGSAFTKGSCTNRVLRGGSWGGRPEILRSAYRSRNIPENRVNFTGFRLARTL